jgi:hypothetical protein
LLLVSRQSFAQSSARDSAEAESYVAVGVGAFLPLEQSYRINYSTSLGGLPIELDAALLLPISRTVLLDLGLSYLTRSANFIADTRISSFAIEPGIRIFLEPQRPQDFRIFALGGVIVAHTSVSGVVDATPDGTNPTQQSVSRSYLPIGGDVGLGLSYPISATTSVDGIVRTSVFFGSPSTSGGLGNIGGVSLMAQYRFGL